MVSFPPKLYRLEVCAYLLGERVLGSSQKRTKVVFTEEARVGGSGHRHRGPLMSQTFPIAGDLGVCEP